MQKSPIVAERLQFAPKTFTVTPVRNGQIPTSEIGRGPSARLRARPSKEARFLTEKPATAALGKYIKAHPKTHRVTVAIKGSKIVVTADKSTPTTRKRGRLAVAPPGLFASLYTAEEAAEDNRMAAHSMTFDSADLPE